MIKCPCARGGSSSDFVGLYTIPVIIGFLFFRFSLVVFPVVATVLCTNWSCEVVLFQSRDELVIAPTYRGVQSPNPRGPAYSPGDGYI